MYLYSALEYKSTNRVLIKPNETLLALIIPKLYLMFRLLQAEIYIVPCDVKKRNSNRNPFEHLK